jgi:hypothetical protein
MNMPSKIYSECALFTSGDRDLDSEIAGVLSCILGTLAVVNALKKTMTGTFVAAQTNEPTRRPGVCSPIG